MPDNMPSPFIACPLFAERKLSLIYSGESDESASILSQVLAMHIAAGIDAYTLQIPERTPVIYLGLCGRSMVVYDRKKVWCRTVDPSGEILSKATFQFLQSSQPANLCSEKARRDLIDWIEGRDAAFQRGGAAPLGLIVVDPLRRALACGRLTHEHVIESALAFAHEVWARGIRAAIIFVIEGERESDLPNCHHRLKDAAQVWLKTATVDGAYSIEIVAAPDVPGAFRSDFNKTFGAAA